MNHNKNIISSEIDRLRLVANMHRDAAKTGLPFECGGHTYKGDAGWHLSCARTLEKMADNLERQL